MRWLSIVLLFVSVSACTDQQLKKRTEYVDILTSSVWMYDVDAIVNDSKREGISDRDLTRIQGIMSRLSNSRWQFLKDGTLEIEDLKGMQGGKWSLNMKDNTLSIMVYGTVATTPLPIESITPEQIVLLPEPKEQEAVTDLYFKRIFKPAAPKASEG